MKKDFTTTAAAFITTPKPDTAPAITPQDSRKPGEPELLIMYRKPKCNPGEEARTRRSQLLTRPSLYNAAMKYAQEQKMSFNSMVETALEYYLKTHTPGGKKHR